MLSTIQIQRRGRRRSGMTTRFARWCNPTGCIATLTSIRPFSNLKWSVFSATPGFSSATNRKWPSPTTFLATTLGREPVLLTRDDDKQLHVIFNRCAHRGVEGLQRGTRQRATVPLPLPRVDFTGARARLQRYRSARVILRTSILTIRSGRCDVCPGSTAIAVLYLPV